jgi:chaperonin GroES
MSMIQPLEDRVLVIPDTEPEFYDVAKQLLRPDVHKERPCTGTVLAIGVGLLEHRAQRLGLHTGSKVVYGKFSGAELKVDGIECLILKVDEILGIETEANLRELMLQWKDTGKLTEYQLAQLEDRPYTPPEAPQPQAEEPDAGSYEQYQHIKNRIPSALQK